MKYGKDLACARLLGELAAVGLPDFEQLPPDAVLFPVPVSRGRAIVRGFNQAMELALPLGRIKSLEIDGESIYKRRAGKTQSTLDAHSRRANIRGAFGPARPVSTETAIVVDDVLTSGATASAMAGALKAAGARRVLVWTIAAA
jgi:ComF family protein